MKSMQILKCFPNKGSLVYSDKMIRKFLLFFMRISYVITMFISFLSLLFPLTILYVSISPISFKILNLFYFNTDTYSHTHTFIHTYIHVHTYTHTQIELAVSIQPWLYVSVCYVCVFRADHMGLDNLSGRSSLEKIFSFYQQLLIVCHYLSRGRIL